MPWQRPCRDRHRRTAGADKGLGVGRLFAHRGALAFVAAYSILVVWGTSAAAAAGAGARAAPVISRPVVAVPILIASVVDIPRSRASTIRDTRNTS